jgi:dipeptidyl-peptidase-4
MKGSFRLAALAAPTLITALVLTHTPWCAAALTIEDIAGVESLSGPKIQEGHVAPDRGHVAFLRGRSDDRYQLDIWVMDAQGGTARRLTDSAALLPQEALSDAEKARRERERTAEFHGILAYSWARDGQSLLFQLGGDLYLQSIDPAHPRPRRLLHAKGSDDAVLDPTLSPGGHYVSFVRNQQLWVMDLRSGRSRRVSREGGGLVHAGEAEFVAQEEFDERHGYWWAPDDSALIYKVVDESPVAATHRLEVYADHAALVEQRYPAAGAANAHVHLRVATLDGAPVHDVPGSDQREDYLLGITWRPDGRGFFYQHLKRAQNRLDLVAVSWPRLQRRILLTERSDTWISVSPQFRPLRQGGFLWGSTRSGYPHLYRHDEAGQLIGALTAGNWSVDSLLAVDEARDIVYFDANRDGVADRQVYATRLEPGSPIRRLSTGEGWHSAEFAENGAPYIDAWSDPDTPPRVAMRDAEGRQLAWLEENRLDEHHPYWPHVAEHATWEYGQLPGHAGPLDYALLKPKAWTAGRRYPAVVLVYGGPSLQTIRHEWDESLFEQFLAQQGYLVFRVDNRGSPRRGKAFADAVFHHLGQVEVEDQGAGLDWLRAQPFVDPQRVGVFGWSYGGYMSLMMQARLADRLAAGVVVAPVTDWRLYDTAYTERYLGTPQNNPEGYRDGEVFPYLGGLRRPLLLLHGMADDNVLFTNSTRLMAELQRANLQFELMTYPGAKHGIDTPERRRHLYTLVRDFLARHL